MPLKHWKTTLVFGILFLILSYFYFDRPVALYFQTLEPSTRALFKTISDIAFPWWHILLWLVIYYFLRFVFRQPSFARKVILIAISINVANAVSTVFKNFFGRGRPDLFFSHNFYGFHLFSFIDANYMSFPSGHAVTIAALMGALACVYPRGTVPFFLFAAFIAFCRVISTSHYLSDALGGLLLGLLTVHFIYLSMKKEINFD